MPSAPEVTKLLEGMIATKRKYLEKNPSRFIEKEIATLETFSQFIADSSKVVEATQLSYRLLLRSYEADFSGKINPENYNSFEEWRDNIKRLTEDKV